MIELLPAVLSNLQKIGKNIEFCQFLSSIAEDEFPLFLDVASWYSLENTSQMKYSDESMVFWKAMYRFFHGKVLRFMSGEKSCVLCEESRCGYYLHIWDQDLFGHEQTETLGMTQRLETEVNIVYALFRQWKEKIDDFKYQISILQNS